MNHRYKSAKDVIMNSPAEYSCGTFNGKLICKYSSTRESMHTSRHQASK